MQSRTPMVLITGSLGSGKTTLLRHVLDSPKRRVAVLMNEFGEIGIDGLVIQGRNVHIIELAGGCVCCTLTGELREAVDEIIRRSDPEYILVEATGVAEGDALVYQLDGGFEGVRLDGVVWVVDAYASVHFPQVGYTARTQLEVADIVLINKTDLVSSAEVGQVEARIRRFNDRAVLVRTVLCAVDEQILFGPPRGPHVPLGPMAQRAASAPSHR